MYKVVLIDDEEIIAEGLRTAFPWHEFSCMVAATAYSGLTGAEAIRRHVPDIVICDIRMPGQDGLSMLAGLRSEFPRMQVSVLSGYPDFEYARQAIALGVTRYLVKPSRTAELREAVAAMLEALTRREREDLPEPEVDNYVVRGALAYIHKNYAEKVTLQDVADQVYVSSWHLSKLFKKHTGENFSDLLRRERVEQAKKLLKTPSYRINDIAELTGFADVTHFSKVFKRFTGFSPGTYRNKKL